MPTRILIVEDYPAIASVAATMATMEGYEVKVAHTGADAIAIFDSFQPQLMILDIMLAGPVGGEEVLAHVRAAGSRIPVLVLSALVGVGGLSFDGDPDVATMAKPFKVRELSRRIAAMLRSASAAAQG